MPYLPHISRWTDRRSIAANTGLEPTRGCCSRDGQVELWLKQPVHGCHPCLYPYEPCWSRHGLLALASPPPSLPAHLPIGCCSVVSTRRLQVLDILVYSAQQAGGQPQVPTHLDLDAPSARPRPNQPGHWAAPSLCPQRSTDHHPSLDFCDLAPAFATWPFYIKAASPPAPRSNPEEVRPTTKPFRISIFCLFRS